MNDLCFLTAWSRLDDTGFANPQSRTAWPGERSPDGPLRWSWFSAAPFERFGRLDLLSQYAVAAAELALQVQPLSPAEAAGAALCLGTAHGSLAADCEFLAGANSAAGPSPTVFSYTLPSAAIGEISIRHQLTGPSLCLLCPPGDELSPLQEAVRLLIQREARAVLCVVADAVPDLYRRAALGAAATDRVAGYACAFLLEAAPPAERSVLANVSVVKSSAAGAGEMSSLEQFTIGCSHGGATLCPGEPYRRAKCVLGESIQTLSALEMLCRTLADGEAAARLELPGLRGTGETLAICREANQR